MKIITPQESGLDPTVSFAYSLLGRLPDGRICGVHRLMFHWTLHVDISDTGHSYRYCYQTETRAQAGLLFWTTQQDPPLWHKRVAGHRHGGSLRRNPVSGKTWHDGELEPDHVSDLSAYGRRSDFLRRIDLEAQARLPAGGCVCAAYAGLQLRT